MGKGWVITKSGWYGAGGGRSNPMRPKIHHQQMGLMGTQWPNYFYMKILTFDEDEYMSIKTVANPYG